MDNGQKSVMTNGSEFKFQDLTVYKKAFILSMKIFEISKSFPETEKFAITNQIRRSSRSVYAAIAEAYRKRMYEAHFKSKTTDADMENSETAVWIDFAFSCGFITKELSLQLKKEVVEIGKMLNHMIENPKKYQRGFGKTQAISVRNK
jgi:four helix bundle protein